MAEIIIERRDLFLIRRALELYSTALDLQGTGRGWSDRRRDAATCTRLRDNLMKLTLPSNHPVIKS